MLRFDARRQLSNKMRKYLKNKTNALRANSKNKNITDLYGAIMKLGWDGKLEVT
jgi:hypothetical protein